MRPSNARNTTDPTAVPPAPRSSGLSLRSITVAVVALFLVGVWVEYVEKFGDYGGPLGENFPPNAAVGVILGVMGMGWLLHRLRPALRLTGRELVVIYAGLVLAAPLCSQGLWGRFFGLLAGIPHQQDFTSYDSLPPMLWPHGRNLVPNGRFAKDLEGFTVESAQPVRWDEIDRGAKGRWRSPVIDHGEDDAAVSTLTVTLPQKNEAGRFQMVPGERFLFSMLVRATGFRKGSSYRVALVADDGVPHEILNHTADTPRTYADPGGFRRVGANPVSIPRELAQQLHLVVTLRGAGALAVQDLEFFNNEATEGLYSGRGIVHASDLEKLGPHERDFLTVKPDRMFSLAGLRYLFTGFIPWGQWARPLLAWLALIGAIFTGLLGLNLIMGRQWAENERFSFPQTILPRHLFADVPDAGGGVRFPIFVNRVMWLGFAITLPLCILKGLNFYNPAVPFLGAPTLAFADYFDSPILKAFFRDVRIDGGGIGLALSFAVLAVALLVETDVLFSLWAFFLLFQTWNMLGVAFNFNRFPGYPWPFQQSIGSYLGFGLIALYVARGHLRQVAGVIFRRPAAGDASPVARDARTYRAALAMVVGSLAGLAGWGAWVGMGWWISLLYFGYMLSVGFTASRIRAETGTPFSYMLPYFAMQFVAALGGFTVFGPTGMLVATMTSGFLVTSNFMLMSATQLEMLELGRQFGMQRRVISTGLALGLLAAVLIGGFTVLCWAYGFGANSMQVGWPYEQNWYYNGFRTGQMAIDRAFEAGTVGQQPESQPLNILRNPDAKGISIGLTITVLLALVRAQFAWFPLHPVGYVLAPTFFMKGFFFTAFVAWAIRILILRLGGARRIRNGLVPFSIGMFLAVIASVMIFEVVGIFLRMQGVTAIYSKLP